MRRNRPAPVWAAKGETMRSSRRGVAWRGVGVEDDPAYFLSSKLKRFGPPAFTSAVNSVALL
jgi:hypothetical protein